MVVGMQDSPKTLDSTTMSGDMNPRIVAISGPLKDSIFSIDESDLFIGRSPKCGVHLDDPSVLRKHCRPAEGHQGRAVS